MSKPKSIAEPKDKEVVGVVQENQLRGFAYSLIGPVAGALLWVVLWEVGFIASLSSWLTAAWTAKFYAKGAGMLTRRSLRVIVPVILAGIALSFFAGVISDVYAGYGDISQKEHFTNQGFFSRHFFDFASYNLSRAEVWASYKWSILMSVVFAGMGSYGTIISLFSITSPQVVAEEEPAEAPKKTTKPKAKATSAPKKTTGTAKTAKRAKTSAKQ